MILIFPIDLFLLLTYKWFRPMGSSLKLLQICFNSFLVSSEKVLFWIFWISFSYVVVCFMNHIKCLSQINDFSICFMNHIKRLSQINDYFHRKNKKPSIHFWWRFHLQANTMRQQQPANQTKQIFWHIFKKCKRLIYFLARILREMVEAKSDLHKIQDIFYLKHFLIEETMSYDRN